MREEREGRKRERGEGGYGEGGELIRKRKNV